MIVNRMSETPKQHQHGEAQALEDVDAEARFHRCAAPAMIHRDRIARVLTKLAECTFREATRLARDRRSVVLLPLGAIEQHGPHLRCSSTGSAPRSWRDGSRRI